jgi:hypothetical protein
MISNSNFISPFFQTNNNFLPSNPYTESIIPCYNLNLNFYLTPCSYSNIDAIGSNQSTSNNNPSTSNFNISTSNKNQSDCNQNNPKKRIFSAEHREKLSVARRGRKLTLETTNKMSVCLE